MPPPRKPFKKKYPQRDDGPRSGPRSNGRPPRDDPRRSGPPPVRREAPGPLGPGVRIVHEDADLIVVEKPPDLLTADATGEGRDSLLRRLQHYIRDRSPTVSRSRARDLEAAGKPPGGKRQLVGIIHRLDRTASGLLVFSLSHRAYSWLKDDFKNKRVHRMYVAVVEGVMGAAGDTGTIQTFMREADDGRVEVVPMDQYRGLTAGNREEDSVQGEAARLAVTHYRVMGVGQGRTLLQLRLATGRKNQIRAHLAYKGFPIVGDERFDARSNPINRVALHATELGFTHPGSGQQVRFNSPAPPAFYAAADMKPPEVASQTHEQRLNPRLPRPEEKDTSWNAVAAWYDELTSDRGNDHYSQVIIPGTLRLVGPHEGLRVLDVACGQGVIARAMSGLGAKVTGVDAAPDLIEAAKSRGGGTFVVGDVRQLDALDVGEGYDVATAIMALMNIEPIEPVLEGVAARLKDGGALVVVISHPAFRAPKQTRWAWDDSTEPPRQYRRVDGYLSPGQHRIQMHPGQSPDVITWTFHRPVQAYVKALASAGFVIEGLEEWSSKRASEQGPRAAEEDRARREIPLFLAIRAVKRLARPDGPA